MTFFFFEKDSNGCTALHYAVTLGHADATAMLLDLSSDPNRQDRKGRTPAHCGCAKGQFETVSQHNFSLALPAQHKRKRMNSNNRIRNTYMKYK